jgi:hypothetical protein
MRNLVVVTFALCAGGCASVNVENVGQGAYTLTVPTDTFSSRHAMEIDAAEEAGDVCPQGWVKVAVKDLPSDVSWTIQCTRAVLVPEAALSSQPEVPAPDTVAPLANVHPSSPAIVTEESTETTTIEQPAPRPGAASAPPENLTPSPSPAPKPDDDAVPPEKL